MRQLTAAAGDGWLGSVGSPGQLETSLNSGYTVGPCNSYLEGPTPILWACCSRPLFGLAARASRARHPTPSSLFANGKACSLITPPIVGRAISDARSLGVLHVPTRSSFVAQHPTRRLPASGSLGFRPGACRLWGRSDSDPTLPMSGTHVQSAACTMHARNVCSVTGTHVHAVPTHDEAAESREHSLSARLIRRLSRRLLRRRRCA